MIGKPEGDIVYVSCTEAGFEESRNLRAAGVEFAEVVSLTQKQADRHAVSGY